MYFRSAAKAVAATAVSMSKVTPVDTSFIGIAPLMSYHDRCFGRRFSDRWRSTFWLGSRGHFDVARPRRRLRIMVRTLENALRSPNKPYTQWDPIAREYISKAS